MSPDVNFININSKEEAISLIIEIIRRSANFTNTPYDILAKEIADRLPVTLSEFDKSKSALVFTWDCTKGKTTGSRFNVGMEVKNACDNDLLNVLKAFLFGLHDRGISRGTLEDVTDEAINTIAAKMRGNTQRTRYMCTNRENGACGDCCGN